MRYFLCLLTSSSSIAFCYASRALIHLWSFPGLAFGSILRFIMFSQFTYIGIQFCQSHRCACVYEVCVCVCSCAHAGVCTWSCKPDCKIQCVPQLISVLFLKDCVSLSSLICSSCLDNELHRNSCLNSILPAVLVSQTLTWMQISYVGADSSTKILILVS